VCTSSGFNGYTETKEVNGDVYSRNSVQGLVGSYRLGVEVHYMDEVVTLHSIKYFGTYFVFSKYINLLLYRYPAVILSLYCNQY
jgi:hypothetical protein